MGLSYAKGFGMSLSIDYIDSVLCKEATRRLLLDSLVPVDPGVIDYFASFERSEIEREISRISFLLGLSPDSYSPDFIAVIRDAYGYLTDDFVLPGGRDVDRFREVLCVLREFLEDYGESS